MSIAATPQLSYFLGLCATASPTATASQSSITIMAQAKLPDAANPGGFEAVLDGQTTPWQRLDPMKPTSGSLPIL